MNAIDCAMRMARIVKASARLKAWGKDVFEVEPCVRMGFRQNMEDWEKDAPFLIFVPNSTRRDAEAESAEVTMFIGVREHVEYMDGGVSVLAAYPILREALGIACAEIAEQLRGVMPTAMVEDTVQEYRQENYPLIWASVEITVREPLPIGFRRK